MRLQPTLILSFLLLTSLLYNACTDPTLAGADLLDEDIAEVDFTDTFSLATVTLPDEAVQTFSPFSIDQLSTYLFGDMVDPVFGRASSAINVQFYPYVGNGSTQNPDALNPIAFEDYIAIDSVVLLLPYSTSGFYGNLTDQTFEMSISELDQVINVDDDYFSDFPVPTKAGILTTHSFMPSATDTLTFFDYREDNSGEISIDTISYAHLRVPIPTAFGDSLLQAYYTDSTVYESRLGFLTRFPGLRLEPTLETEGMVRFFLSSSSTAPARTSGLHVYYRDSSDQARRYLFNFNPNQNIRFPTFEHDYSGTVVEEYLDGGAENDSLIFLQGMAGTSGQLRLPDLSELGDVVINKAELTMYVADLEDGDTTYAVPRQLVLAYENEDGESEFVSDLIVADLNADVPVDFGGVPEEDEDTGLTRYQFNISTHLQRVIEGTLPRELSIYPIETNDIVEVKKAETAERVVLYGATHPTYAPVLRLTFTRL
jgi:hypothetical protein